MLAQKHNQKLQAAMNRLRFLADLCSWAAGTLIFHYISFFEQLETYHEPANPWEYLIYWVFAILFVESVFILDAFRGFMLTQSMLSRCSEWCRWFQQHWQPNTCTQQLCMDCLSSGKALKAPQLTPLWSHYEEITKFALILLLLVQLIGFERIMELIQCFLVCHSLYPAGFSSFGHPWRLWFNLNHIFPSHHKLCCVSMAFRRQRTRQSRFKFHLLGNAQFVSSLFDLGENN